MLKFIFCLIFSLFMNSWVAFVVMCFFLSLAMIISGFVFDLSKVGFFMESDFLSCSLNILSFWVVGLCVLASLGVKNKKNNVSFFLFLMSVLLLFLIFSFSFNNYLLFYISFECCLIPILVLILGWGYQPERSQAGMYMMFYTLFASLPLLVLILNKINLSGLSMVLCDFYFFGYSGVVSFFLVGAFLVKFPMYMTHLWLPKAHVEAPVAGSMILAGVLLKLGGYGMIRFLPAVFYFPDIMQSCLVSISVWGGLLVSLVCLSQLDMKLLIACSSVVHMSTCISALLIMNDWGVKGAVLMMLAHGLCSSGLFFLAGVVYDRSGSRSLSVNKGLMNLMPSMSLWWFLLLSANMAAPPTINLLSEISLISSILGWSGVMSIPLGLLTFFSASYSLYLFSLSQHGKFVQSIQGVHIGSLIEFLIAFMHWAPLNLFILSAFLFY